MSGGRCALGGMMLMAGDTQGEDAHVTILMCTTPTRERCAAVPRYRVLSPVRCYRATQMIQLRADGESTFLRAARPCALAHLPSCVRVPVGSGASHGFSPGGGQASGIGPLDPRSGPCLSGSPPNASACSGGFLRPFAARGSCRGVRAEIWLERETSGGWMCHAGAAKLGGVRPA